MATRYSPSPARFASPSPVLQETVETKQQTDDAIQKMKTHLTEMSKLMDSIQSNTNRIDDDVDRCENIIKSTFAEISTILDERKDALISDLHKTAQNKKLALLLQHNELNNQYQESQGKINKIDEMVHKLQANDSNKASDAILESLHLQMADKDLLSSNFDLHFNKDHSKQLIQIINRFGSISVNPVPNLLSVSNNGKNYVVEIKWKLPSASIATLNTAKTQKIRIEWCDTTKSEETWNHKEFVISSDDKKQKNKSENGHTHLINVGGNGAYSFRVRHYYLAKWSKASNAKSIVISGVSYDYWDTIYHGHNIRIEGKSVAKKNTAGYESAFLNAIASEGAHQWTFKLEGGQNRGSARIFGVWRVDKDKKGHDEDEKVKEDGYGNNVDINTILDTYFTNEKYVEPNSHQTYGKAFGSKCREGDIVDMYLDLKLLKLFYKLNGTIYGKPVDVARAHYKAVVAFYSVDDRVRLINYSKN